MALKTTGTIKIIKYNNDHFDLTGLYTRNCFIFASIYKCMQNKSNPHFNKLNIILFFKLIKKLDLCQNRNERRDAFMSFNIIKYMICFEKKKDRKSVPWGYTPLQKCLYCTHDRSNS